MLLRTYLEGQPRLHLLRQGLGDATIKVRQDLHRQLGLDATLADEIIEGICERHADAVHYTTLDLTSSALGIGGGVWTSSSITVVAPPSTWKVLASCAPVTPANAQSVTALLLE